MIPGLFQEKFPFKASAVIHKMFLCEEDFKCLKVIAVWWKGHGAQR